MRQQWPSLSLAPLPCAAAGVRLALRGARSQQSSSSRSSQLSRLHRCHTRRRRRRTAVARRERGEAAVALSISRPAAVRRCREAASSTRRTSPAEQLDTSESMIETAPLYHASMTPPFCGCEERAG